MAGLGHLRLLGLLLVLAGVLAGCRSPEKYVDVATLQQLPADPYVYRICPGDELHVDIQQDPDYDWNTTVLPDGAATFKFAGELDVMGKTLREARDLLKDRLVRYYTAPNMTLQLRRIAGPDPIVFLGSFGASSAGALQGHSSRAGLIPYRKGIGIMEALGRAGGVAEPDVDAVPYIYVIRNIRSIKERTVYRFDLAAAVRGESPELPLHPGDVMFVDQSWLQDVGRALGIFTQVVGTATQGLATALLVDSVADGGLAD